MRLFQTHMSLATFADSFDYVFYFEQETGASSDNLNVGQIASFFTCAFYIVLFIKAMIVT